MGHVHQKVHLRGEKAATVRMLVDTDATFSVIPPRLARALGIKQPRRSVSVTVADGRRVRLGADLAVVKIDGREAPTTILIGTVSEPILGVEAWKRWVYSSILPKNVSPRHGLYAVGLGGYH